MVPVDESYTGVLVMPICGHRSWHPATVDAQAVPTDLDHCTAPVSPLRLYTVSLSVATITLLLGGVVPDPGLSTTSGWAYTCPSTLVAKSWPNLPLVSVCGESPGSFGSQPSRSRFDETVSSSAWAATCAPSWAPVMASATTAREVAIRAIRIRVFPIVV